MSRQNSGSGRTETTHALTDERMELLMGRLLQTGVFVAAAVVAAGGLLYVVHHGTEHVAYGTFRPRPLNLKHPLSVLTTLRRSGAAGVVDAGILILIATPICRVVLALVSFAIERDRLYVLVSTIVLAALLFGLLHGG
jgi:uncharacterized membrane protein